MDEDDPLVCELERRALAHPFADPPEVGELPAGFEAWAEAALHDGRYPVARLAGLLISRHRPAHANLAALLVLPLARVVDLPLLRRGLEVPGVEALIDELEEAAENLPAHLTDALVAVAFEGVLRDPCLLVLFQNVEHLARLRAPPGGALGRLVARLTSAADDRVQEQEAARPCLETLLTSARREADRLGAPRSLTAASVVQAASRLEVPDLSVALLELAGTSREAGVPALLMNLAIVQVLSRTRSERRWAEAFRERASRIIHTLRVPALLELRLRLLDVMIEEAEDPVAHWFFQRANTRLNAGPRTEEVERLALQDLETAMNSARTAGDADTLADAVAAWVKVVVHRPHDQALVVEAESRIAHALSNEPTPERQATLLQARGYLIRLHDPCAAAGIFEAARERLSSDDPLRWELAAEAVAALVASGDGGSAASLADRLLDQAPAGTQAVGVAMLMFEASEAFLRAGRPQADVRRLLETGLGLIRGLDSRMEAMVHLRLASLEGNLDSAERHLALAQDHQGAMDQGALLDAQQVRAEVAAARGDTAAALTALGHAVELAANTPSELGLRLMSASIELASGRTPVGVDALLQGAIPAQGLGPDVCALLERIGCRHGDRLERETLGALSAWAGARGRPSVQAKLLLNRREEPKARDVLRAALAGDLDAHERLACTSLLVGCLPPEGRAERVRLSNALEGLIDQRDDVPQARLDLATALRVDADGEPGLFRAWRHGLRALGGLRDVGEIAHGHRELALIAFARVRSRMAESTPDLAELARWLVDEHPVDRAELAEIRLGVAMFLLYAGPLTHPSGVEVATALATLAERELGPTDQVRILRERCSWIVAAHAGTPWRGGRPRQLGPFDEAPAWLVGLVAGRPENVAPGGVAFLENALRARPDRADSLLAQFVACAPGLDQDARRAVMALAHDVSRRPEEWQRTREALRALPAQTPHSEAPSDVVARRFQTARALMQSVQIEPLPPDALERITSARAQLSEAASVARAHAQPALFDVLVTLGNAWKTPPGANLETAFRCYDDAEKLGGNEDQLAKLWKVTADALRDRGGPDDRREAARLLERSAAARRGPLRVETLRSAALVAEVNPDLDEAGRVVQSAEFLVEAARTDASTAEPLLGWTLRALSRWAQLRSQDPRPVTLVRELQALYPNRSAEITLNAPAAASLVKQRVLSSLRHPASAALIRETTAFALAGAQPPASLVDIQAWTQARLAEAFANPDLLVRQLARVEECRGADDTEAPGLAVARVVLLAALVRHGRRLLNEVRSATDEAFEVVSSVADSAARALLMRELGRAWAPANSADDPVRDFGRAADLAARAIDAEGGEESASTDSLEYRARALRYSGGIAEAKRLYELILQRARADGQVDVHASALMGVAEIVSHDGDGAQAARLQEGQRLLEEAAFVARDPVVRARAVAALAWQRTQAALADGGPDAVDGLQRSSADFDRVDLNRLSSEERRWLEHNRVVCHTAIARTDEDRIRIWRVRVEGGESPYERATAQHNLALALLSGPVTHARFTEAIALCEQAAPVRAEDAKHSFETAMLAGSAMTSALDAGAPAATWERGLKWLRRAIDSARSLGHGSELAMGGLALARLAAHAPTTQAFMETGDEAWAAVMEARPYLLFDHAMREREAGVASEIVVALARRLATETISVASANIAFVLREERADAVLRWLSRTHGPLRRPLRARLSPPAGVPVSLWQEWLAVVARRDPLALVETLRRVRDLAPGFLSGEDLEATWSWLSAHPGSLAVSVSLSLPVSVAVLLNVDRSGGRCVQALGLAVPPPPQDPGNFATCMRGVADGDPATTRAHRAMLDWARAGVVEPILRFHGERPSRVLWCPGPGLRLVAPTALWEVPVVCTAALDLPEASKTPARPRSTLVVLADPGPESMQGLGRQGQAAIAELATVASRRGRVRRLASAGNRFGVSLLGPAPDLRDRAASAEEILAEAKEHDVVVLVAHGLANSPDDAAILCVDASGAVDRLDVAALSRCPEAFSGAVVMLLSCETGRVGETLAEPGGVAGALVAGGASAVIGPLWPVRLDVALEVAREVLEVQRSGGKPEEAIARVCGTLGPPAGGPSLGPAPSSAAQRETSVLQRLSFVTWVG